MAAAAGIVSGSARATSSGFTSRPTMAWTSAPMSALAMLSSATSRPVRSTATRSATLAISASLCVTRMTARPESATRRQISSSEPISPGGSTAVGSSSTRSLGSRIRHFTISARWRSPTESSPTTASGSSVKPKLSAMSRMRAPNSGRFSMPLTWPSIRFSTTVMRGTRLKCWCTMAMPCSRASAGLAGAHGAPPKVMWPALGS